MKNKDMFKELVDIFQLMDILNKNGFEKEYGKLNINEVHTIDFIGKNTKNNSSEISKYLHITRSGATKIIKKLLEKNYILEYSTPENKKEKYFNLTKAGENIYKKHLENHKKSQERDSKIFDTFDLNEKKVIHEFLNVLKDDLKKKVEDIK
ncbi:MAG: winged helix DNA-binding protein [Cetobacterium sp.]